MSFLFVDQILDLIPGSKSVGIKHVTLNDTYLKTIHDKPTLRSSIVGEALGQLCSWNVLKTSDYQFRAVGGVIQEIEIRHLATVGETILLESDIEMLDVDNLMVSFSGRASVGGKTLLLVKNSLAPLQPLEDYNHKTVVQANFNTLYQPRTPIHYPAEKNNLPALQYTVAYDQIISHEKNKELVAIKTISASAPYFLDHFPKKPVFPLSLLMEYNLELAHLLISEINPTWQPRFLKKIKIGNFVLPGDTLTTRILLKEKEKEHALMRFHNSVDGKKVCVGDVELGLG